MVRLGVGYIARILGRVFYLFLLMTAFHQTSFAIDFMQTNDVNLCLEAVNSEGKLRGDIAAQEILQEVEKRELACQSQEMLSIIDQVRYTWNNQSCGVRPDSESCLEFKISAAFDDMGSLKKTKVVSVSTDASNVSDCLQGGCYYKLVLTNGFIAYGEIYEGFTNDGSLANFELIAPSEVTYVEELIKFLQSSSKGDEIEIRKVGFPPNGCSSRSAIVNGGFYWHIKNTDRDISMVSDLFFDVATRKCGGDSFKNYGPNWWQ